MADDILTPPEVKEERFIVGKGTFTVVLSKARELFLTYNYESSTKKWIPILSSKTQKIPITPSKARPDIKTPRRDKDLREQLMGVGYSEDDAKREISQIMGEMLTQGVVNQALEGIEAKAQKTREEPKFNDDIKTQAKQILETEIPLFKIVEIVNTRHIGDPVVIALEWLSALSMHVDGFKQLHISLGGRSGSGKSSSGRKTTWAIPKSWCHTIRSLSSKSIYYAQRAGELNPDFNLFFINDVADTPDAIGTLKALTDTEDDEPEHWTVVDGEYIKLKIPGKKAVWINSVVPVGDDQLNNRFIHANPNQTKEHHIDRSDFLTKRGVTGELNAPPEPIFELAQCITQMIAEERCGVVLPMLCQYDFSKMSPRDQEFLISLIAAVAYSNRYRRWRMEDGKIIATNFDFEIGYQLWKLISKYQYTFLPEDAHQILKILPNEGDTGLRISDIMEKTDMSREAIRRFVWGDKNRETPSLYGLGLIKGKKSGDATTSPWEFWKRSNLGYPKLTPKSEDGDLLKWGIQKALFGSNLLVEKSEDEIISYIIETDSQKTYKYFDPQRSMEKAPEDETGTEPVGGQVGVTENGDKCGKCGTLLDSKKEWVGGGLGYLCPKCYEEHIEEVKKIREPPKKLSREERQKLLIPIIQGSEKWRNKWDAADFSTKDIDLILREYSAAEELSGIPRRELELDVIKFLSLSKKPKKGGKK